MRKEGGHITEENNCLFEGIVSVRAVIKAMAEEKNGGRPARKIEHLYYDRDKTASKEYAWLFHRSEEFGFPIETVSREVIDASAAGTSHGGILAWCGERRFPIIDAKSLPPKGLFFMIDGIEDPYNYGYALRSLWAAGADGVILSPRSWMSAAGAVCRASAGASELMPMYRCPDDDELSALKTVKRAGYRIIGADTANSISVYDADLGRPLLMIVGGEKRGIRKSLYPLIDLVVRLDYGRDFDMALSAASAASILAFEVLRQNTVRR